MSRQDEHSVPPDLQEIARRLEAERPQASELELDRMKLRAMNAASRAARRAGPTIGQILRSGRLATIALAIVLIGGGTAVLANSGGPTSGSSHESASKKEYEDDDCGQGQDEKGRNKSKANGSNVCQQCDKASSNKTVSKNNSNNGGSNCKPQCDKATSNKTVSNKNGSNEGGGGNPNCKPGD
jgi:hypothetical protein